MPNRTFHRYKKKLLKVLFTACLFALLPTSRAQVLKSIVYDFDGFDLNQTSIPEGDYSYGDLAYKITANPLNQSHMLGDRVLRADVTWNAGYGAFGRGVTRYIEMNRATDRFNFFIYNPTSNNQSATIEIVLGDDDNLDKVYSSSSDDSWRKEITVPGGNNWQLISVPLSDFIDSNPGGNGVFDIAFTQNKGVLLQVELKFLKKNPTAINATFYLDMLCFSEGILPRGTTELDLPYSSPSDYCYLGVFHPTPTGNHATVPQTFHSYFPSVPGKKIVYVNTFLQWATGSSTIANGYPGNSIQTLLSNGYKPIITWEPMFKGYAPLNAVQPNLDKINNGVYDNYIDSVAGRIKQYSDTVIIRLMHEFDGNWYSWSISQNGGDPLKFVNAFKRIVQRFRDKGAYNVKWFWCPNNSFAPNEAYNFIVNAYPGDNYVDIVGTDVYNAHYPVEVPWWRSFRWQTAEVYYYLTKYFPSKPFFVAEQGVRERLATEDPTSQTKAQWYAAMDKELQSNFRKTRALIFFNSNGTQTWAVNTSTAAIQSLTTNFWYDSYYFPQQLVTAVEKNEYGNGLYVYPNPTTGQVTFSYNSSEPKDEFFLTVYNSSGAIILTESIKGSTSNFSKISDMSHLSKGLYLVELQIIKNGQTRTEQRKLILL